MELFSKTGNHSLCAGFICCEGFHACSIPYVESVWPCLPCHLATLWQHELGAKPRMGSQKSKQKSPRTVSRHPPPYLSHTSNFHHNHCLETRSCICYLAFCTSECSGWHQKRVLWFEQRVSGCWSKKPRYFCDAASQLERVGTGGRSNCRRGERSRNDQHFAVLIK